MAKPGSDQRFEVVRHSERPELWRDTAAIAAEVWPEYNRHGDVLGRYWDRLFEDFAEFQIALYDAVRGEVLAEGHAAPCAWNGTTEGLPEGIDAAIEAAFERRETGAPATALCALAAEVRPRFQRRGLSGELIDVMAALARDAGLAHLIAPVRPSLKDRYPITPIERYVAWTRADGEPFDPWLRVHVRRGGSIVRPAPRSMLITATIAEWERWTGMPFPGDGCYTFPDGLAPLDVDRAAGLGRYWEPNVWVVHRLA